VRIVQGLLVRENGNRDACSGLGTDNLLFRDPLATAKLRFYCLVTLRIICVQSQVDERIYALAFQALGALGFAKQQPSGCKEFDHDYFNVNLRHLQR
jgi:hypothetical protein